MAITRITSSLPRCRFCERALLGVNRVYGECVKCFERSYRLPARENGPRPPDLALRIEYYQSKAAKGLPLFDPPFSGDVA